MSYSYLTQFFPFFYKPGVSFIYFSSTFCACGFIPAQAWSQQLQTIPPNYVGFLMNMPWTLHERDKDVYFVWQCHMTIL